MGALRAGVPTIITPMIFDQFDHSFVVQNLGVGVGFKQQLQKINASDLSKAIDSVLNDPAMIKKAKEVGEIVRKESGCRGVVEEVERYWKEDVTSGKFLEENKDWISATNEMRSRIKRETLRTRVVLAGVAVAVAGVILTFLMK